MILFLAVATAVGLAFALVPGLDLAIESLFYDPDRGFWLADSAYARFWYEGIPLVRNWVVVPLGVLGLVWLGLRRRLPFGIPPRAFLLVVLTLALGSGVLVNEVFKNHWGRARPEDVTAFGGDRAFTPAFVPADQCDRNCSWVSGHPSFVFAGFSVALLARRRRLAVAAVAVLGAMAGLGRMMQGAHFPSDVVFSGVFMYLVAWGLWRWLCDGVGPIEA